LAQTGTHRRLSLCAEELKRLQAVRLLQRLQMAAPAAPPVTGLVAGTAALLARQAQTAYTPVADTHPIVLFKVGTAVVVALQLETPTVATALLTPLAGPHLIRLVADPMQAGELGTTPAH